VGIISIKLQFTRNWRLVQPRVEHLRSDVFDHVPETVFKGQSKSHHAGYHSHPNFLDTIRQYLFYEVLVIPYRLPLHIGTTLIT
jgi:hypothetical protein